MRVKVKKDQDNLIFFKRNDYCDIYLKLQIEHLISIDKKIYFIYNIIRKKGGYFE